MIKNNEKFSLLMLHLQIHYHFKLDIMKRTNIQKANG